MNEGIVLVNPSAGSPDLDRLARNGIKQYGDGSTSTSGLAEDESIILDVTTLMKDNRNCSAKAAVKDRIFSLNDTLYTEAGNSTMSSKNVFTNPTVPFSGNRQMLISTSSTTCSSGSSSASSTSSTSFIISPSPSTNISVLQETFPPQLALPSPSRDAAPCLTTTILPQVSTSQVTTNVTQFSNKENVSSNISYASGLNGTNEMNNRKQHRALNHHASTNHTHDSASNLASKLLASSETKTKTDSKTNSSSQVHSPSNAAVPSQKESGSDCVRHTTPLASTTLQNKIKEYTAEGNTLNFNSNSIRISDVYCNSDHNKKSDIKLP